jgi:N-acetyl-gamma-glutamyl-phosphate reductase
MARFSLILLAAPAALAFFPSNGSLRRSIDLAAKKKVFIDGEAGTTGIQVRDRLAKRDDLEILSIPDDLRKDEATRKKYINDADAVILCLPDDASEMAASWVEPDDDRTVLIDASTAFRVTIAGPMDFQVRRSQPKVALCLSHLNVLLATIRLTLCCCSYEL